MPIVPTSQPNEVIVSDTGIRVVSGGTQGPASLAAGSVITSEGEIIIGGTGGTPEAADFADLTYGRTRPALQDDFSLYSNGALSGQVPIIGSAWATTGAQPTTILTGRATSTGIGYAVQTFTDTPTVMMCNVSFSGSSATTTTMTMAFCGQTLASGNVLNDLVHCNFGPTGFQLTVRKNAGSFEIVQAGNWFTTVPMDGTVVHIAFAVSTDNATVYGPYGEVFGVHDARIGQALSAAGKTVFWEPTTVTGNQAFMHTASAFTTAATGQTASPLQPDQLAAIVRPIGQSGQLSGNRFDAGEVRIGVSATQDMPALSFGPTEVHAVLQASTIIGATTFQTNQRIPGGATLVIGFGSTQETLTQNGSIASGSGTPYTSTTTVGATKAHTAGDPIVVTGLPTPAEMYFNTSANFFYFPDKVIVVPGTPGFYFGGALDTRLYREGAGILATDAKMHVVTDVEIDGALDHDGTTVGFYGTTPTTKKTVTGAKAGNAALTSLLTQLAALGIITDSSS